MIEMKKDSIELGFVQLTLKLSVAGPLENGSAPKFGVCKWLLWPFTWGIEEGSL